jgi:hypothetical protein
MIQINAKYIVQKKEVIVVYYSSPIHKKKS